MSFIVIPRHYLRKLYPHRARSLSCLLATSLILPWRIFLLSWWIHGWWQALPLQSFPSSSPAPHSDIQTEAPGDTSLQRSSQPTGQLQNKSQNPLSQGKYGAGASSKALLANKVLEHQSSLVVGWEERRGGERRNRGEGARRGGGGEGGREEAEERRGRRRGGEERRKRRGGEGKGVVIATMTHTDYLLTGSQLQAFAVNS